MTTNYNIISCDGGGIRGLITAMLLQDLVQNPPAGSSGNILSNVNLFAGTSTGGIIALGLACGVPISSLVGIYDSSSDCSTIFTPYTPPSGTTSTAIARLRLSSPQATSSFLCELLPDLCYVEYTNTGLYKLVSSTLSTQAQTVLADLTQSVLVATFRISNTSNNPWGPLALTNLPNVGYSNLAVIDAAMCTSAAPLYFPPYGVPPANPTMWCCDGGVFANNPSAFVLANVLESQILQQQKKELSNVMMLSLGTGVTTDYVPSSDINPVDDWGMAAWINPAATAPEPTYPLLAAMFDGQSQIADFESANFLGGNYRRANPTLPITINLDDCAAIGTANDCTGSAANTLTCVAQNYINSSSSGWSEIKQWAYDNFV